MVKKINLKLEQRINIPQYSCYSNSGKSTVGRPPPLLENKIKLYAFFALRRKTFLPSLRLAVERVGARSESGVIRIATKRWR